MPAWFYMLRLKSGQLYIGSTTDLDQRYKDHCSGRACRTTQLGPPHELLYSEELDSFPDARKREEAYRFLASHTPDTVFVVLIVAEHIGAVEHDYPGAFCVFLECC